MSGSGLNLNGFFSRWKLGIMSLPILCVFLSYLSVKYWSSHILDFTVSRRTCNSCHFSGCLSRSALKYLSVSFFDIFLDLDRHGRTLPYNPSYCEPVLFELYFDRSAKYASLTWTSCSWSASEPVLFEL